MSQTTLLLHDADSPAPRCLRMYLLEKGLRIPSVVVDVFSGENRRAPFTDLNPAGQTPALTLPDGSTLAESVAIVEYLEELYPEPALIGATPQERAVCRQWLRRVELNITEFIHNAFHYAEGIGRFRTRIPVVPEAADGLKRVAQDRLAWLDAMMGADPYLCGQRLTAADIWLYVWLDFGVSVGQPFDRGLPHIGPWFNRMAARPSAEASRRPFVESPSA
ncbi:glutathione S-transferase family protein [Paraburkholderia sp.]|uniref:glutathione S-transferase family protein n=1 Tax=Paraburkholderia sp. TaxID=1926495 RepID=UPI0025F0A620|nr:glutathione S-transferase family protein [Paraburkholderia sp.]